MLLRSDIFKKNILDYENNISGIEDAILIYDNLVESKNNTSIYKKEIIFILMTTIFSPFLLILSLWHFNIPILISASSIFVSIFFGLFIGIILNLLFNILPLVSDKTFRKAGFPLKDFPLSCNLVFAKHKLHE
jgi:hypothetical protein